jgi:hypothetical protein
MRIFFLLFCTVLSFLPASPASARSYSPPELEGLLAPIALYPDPVVQDVLTTSAAPDQAARDAAWANLGAYPDLQQRISQSPQWLQDLGDAWLSQPNEVMATVQGLRQRAAAAGTVATGVYPSVQYYDPWVVYGAYWRPTYRPAYWRPWYSAPVVVPRVVVRPAPVVRTFHPHLRVYSQPYHRVPESRRAPIVQSRAGPAFVARPAVRAPAAIARPSAPRNPGFHHHPGARGHR